MRHETRRLCNPSVDPSAVNPGQNDYDDQKQPYDRTANSSSPRSGGQLFTEIESEWIRHISHVEWQRFRQPPNLVPLLTDPGVCSPLPVRDNMHSAKKVDSWNERRLRGDQVGCRCATGCPERQTRGTSIACLIDRQIKFATFKYTSRPLPVTLMDSGSHSLDVIRLKSIPPTRSPHPTRR
jgi:hypothetical protein